MKTDEIKAIINRGNVQVPVSYKVEE